MPLSTVEINIFLYEYIGGGWEGVTLSNRPFFAEVINFMHNIVLELLNRVSIIVTFHDKTIRIVQLAQNEIAFDSNSRRNSLSSSF